MSFALLMISLIHLTRAAVVAPLGRTPVGPVTFPDPSTAYVKAENQTSVLTERENGQYTFLYVCKDVQWSGQCVNLYAPYGICCT